MAKRQGTPSGKSAKGRRRRASTGSQTTVTPIEDRQTGLARLSHLAGVDIETPLVANLSGELHALFDPVSDGVLPIYFGPLLGRLYLERL